VRPGWAAPLAGLLLGACHAGRGSPGAYAQALDSATSACRTRPWLCASTAGEQAVVPLGTRRVADAGASLAAVAAALSVADRERLERDLTDCADLARSEVLVKFLDGRSPTPEECREKGTFGGRFRTRAMFLGEEMHKVALACAEARLKVLRPGGFSVEPRYRYTAEPHRLELIEPDTEAALLEQGCYGELKGTLKPDIVIHTGNPLAPQAVYDFKFPCIRLEDGAWCRYASGPYQGQMQSAVYRKALSVQPFQVIPRIGVMP
jgi:hypothetical protein